MPSLRVLLIDDESSVLESLAFLLDIQGFTIAGTASDLAGAMELASSAEADVAILDINLGKELAFEAADVFVARFIPVLFTSSRTANLPPRFASTTYIGKPYLPEVLIDKIERLTSQARETQPDARTELEELAGRPVVEDEPIDGRRLS